ncbi:hypothetical protein J6590_011553 [Homalodisca vitripennis]|nr:hypothetical protein J6590_011553 [Homalodisca vitripennis]
MYQDERVRDSDDNIAATINLTRRFWESYLVIKSGDKVEKLEVINPLSPSPRQDGVVTPQLSAWRLAVN